MASAAGQVGGSHDPEAALALVVLMPLDDAEQKTLRARIRRWVKDLRDRGVGVPD